MGGDDGCDQPDHAAHAAAVPLHPTSPRRRPDRRCRQELSQMPKSQMSKSQMPKPNLVFAMNPDVTPDLITPELRERLSRSCTLANREPLRDYETAEARRLLAEAEILFTGWGAARIDAPVLAIAP